VSLQHHYGVYKTLCQEQKKELYDREIMGAQSIPRPITVDEYERIPDPPGGRYELHHGEVAFVPFPFREHKDLQRRLRKPLEAMAEPLGFIVDTEYPYQPLPENEVWGADVACVSGPRYRVKKWLEGSPELVIEVKSPSNTKAEMHDKAMTTLAGAGAVEFWIVDAASKTVRGHSKATGIHVYSGDEAVPLPMFGAQIVLSELFISLG
jgi:Uma2 family endonuclease